MAQKVDPFIPVNPEHRRQPAPHRPAHRAPAAKQPALDQLRPMYDVHNPAKPKPVETKAPEVQPKPKTDASRAHPKKQRQRRRWLLPLQLFGAGVGILLAGTLLQATALGELLIALYGVVAIITRIESRTSFTLALISLGCIVIMLLVRPNSALMQNFAIYGFLFLVVGTISLARESRY